MRTIAGIACGLLLASTAGGMAADELVCAIYSKNVEALVKQLTNDDDVAQAAQARAEAYCIVIDEPVDIQINTTPASLTTPKFDPGWVRLCKKYYRSFREADGTVLRRGGKGRTKCPL